MMAYMSPTLTLIMMGIVPPFAGGAVAYGRYVKRLSKETQDALSKTTEVAEGTGSAVSWERHHMI